MTEGDHEHRAFETFAQNKDLERSQHPMFLIYLDPETSNALDAFKAGYLAGQQKATEAKTQ